MNVNNFSEILTFGKYQGKTIRWVFIHDPEYLEWIETKGLLTFSQKDLNRIAEAAIEQRIRQKQKM